MKVAICIDQKSKIHSTNWCFPWEDYCIAHKIAYEKINPSESDIIDKIRDFDILLWHFSGYKFTDMLIARNLLFSAKKMGLKVFPDFDDCWHFDDKLSETYLLQSINAPIPKSFLFYSNDKVEDFLQTNPKFPIIAKLRNGSGSHNVKLIQDKTELTNYAQVMFDKGLNSSPSLIRKASANMKTSKSLKTVINRVKRIPEFLKTLSQSSDFPNERGYVYLQEFIPNEGFDLKIVVIGNKLSFVGRNVVKGDFRASGTGSLFYDKTRITKSIIDTVFKISDTLGFKCMGFDFVVNKETGEEIIVEISYGFSHEAILNTGGYFDRNGTWINEPLNAPKELLSNLLVDE